jgi:hypothetical protein
MPNKTATDALLADCEPYFLDGVHTIAEIVRRTQEIVHDAVNRNWSLLVDGLGFPDGRIVCRDFCDPDKVQKVKPTEGISIGVSLKITDVVEAGFYRYWEPNERPGVTAYIWIKGTGINELSRALDNFPDAWPDPEDAWSSETKRNGAYNLLRELSDSEIIRPDSVLDELIIYFISLLTKVGGLEKFLK